LRLLLLVVCPFWICVLVWEEEEET
jgi:hypothetical protein